MNPRLYIKDFWFHIWQRRLMRFPVAILMYHSVGYNQHFFTVTPEAFRTQMAYLKKKGFSVVPLMDIVTALRNHMPIAAKTIALTFDDGYEDNFTHAFPILQEFGFPATIFVSTDFIGAQRDVRAVPMQHLSREQIVAMYASGLVDIQPHGMAHEKLPKLTHEQVKKEMEGSRDVLAAIVGSPRAIFSYPYGASSESIQILAASLFEAGVGAHRGYVGTSTSLFNLPRQSIDSRVSFRRFTLKV